MIQTSDPRPRVTAGPEPMIAGARCTSCGHPMATKRPVCAACGGPLEDANFGPGGIVYASTIVRIAVVDRTPPYTLAYVDIDDGPRVLAHVAGSVEAAPAVGSHVRLARPIDGDVVVEVAT